MYMFITLSLYCYTLNHQKKNPPNNDATTVLISSLGHGQHNYTQIYDHYSSDNFTGVIRLSAK